MNMNMSTGFQPGYGTAIWSPDLTPMGEPQYIGALIGLFILAVGFRALVAAQGYLEAYLHLHYYPRPSQSFRSPTHYPSPHPAQPLQQQQQLLQDGKIADEYPFLDEKRDTTQLNTLQESLQGQGVQQEEEEISSLPHGSQTVSATMDTAVTGATGSKPRRSHTHRHHRPPVYQSLAFDQHQHQRHHPFEQPTTSFLFPLPTAQSFVWQAEISRAVLTTGVVGIGYMLMLVIMTYNSAYFGIILAGIFVGEVYFGRWGRVRPVFPAAPRPYSSQKRNSNVDNTIGSNSNSSGGGSTPEERPAASSMISLGSRASSHGYSTGMIHHGASDGAC